MEQVKKVRCIDNRDCERSITLNKEYEIQYSNDDELYFIIDDIGKKCGYYKWRFKEVETQTIQLRKEPIKSASQCLEQRIEEQIEKKQSNNEPKVEKTQTDRKIRVFETLAIRSDNTGRERPDFISPYALHALGKFLANTENSFAKINYFRGLPIESCWESISRHYIELGIAIMKGENQDEIKQAVSALTFNGIAMLHTLELKERGEYKVIQEGTKIMSEDEFKELDVKYHYKEK